jgi:hypothetical protein
MPIDLGPLTTTIVTTFLLPYAKLGLEKFGEAMMEKLGETAAEPLIATTKKIWQRVKSAFGSEEEKATLAQFEKRPEAAQALIEALLKEKLEQDAALAQELTELAHALVPGSTSTGAQIMQAAIAGILDVRGANFSGASHVRLAGVMLNNSSSERKTE